MRGLSARGLALHTEWLSLSIIESAVMPANDNENPNQRGPLIALGVVVVLFAIGWLLVHELYNDGKMEDCLMSGRTNCAPIDGANR